MAILPKNIKKNKDITPKVFFIWGQSMSGKTYLARQFADPIILNTDGNAKKVDTPSVEVYDFVTFMGAIKELETTKHDFKTIIIDLVDDIKTMLETHVLEKHGAETLADIQWGKGFSEVKTTWQRLMVRLSQLPYNVVFISHVATTNDDAGQPVEVPSLEQKFYNMTMGRSDMSIKCRKVGSRYTQIVVDKRDNYTREDFKDPQVLAVLENTMNLFTSSNKVVATPVKALKPTGETVEETPKAVKVIKKDEPVAKAEAEVEVIEETPAVADPVEEVVEGIVEEVVETVVIKPIKAIKPIKKVETAEVETAEVVEEEDQEIGYYFDTTNGSYVTINENVESPEPSWVPVPKMVYLKATGVAKQETKQIKPMAGKTL